MENNNIPRMISFMDELKEEAFMSDGFTFGGVEYKDALKLIDSVIIKLVEMETKIINMEDKISILTDELDEYHEKYGELTYEGGPSDGN